MFNFIQRDRNNNFHKTSLSIDNMYLEQLMKTIKGLLDGVMKHVKKTDESKNFIKFILFL